VEKSTTGHMIVTTNQNLYSIDNLSIFSWWLYRQVNLTGYFDMEQAREVNPVG